MYEYITCTVLLPRSQRVEEFRIRNTARIFQSARVAEKRDRQHFVFFFILFNPFQYLRFFILFFFFKSTHVYLVHDLKTTNKRKFS